MTPRLGTDGTRIVYPVRGIVQGARELAPQTRTVVYVAALTLAATLTAVSLLAAGYTVEAPVTVLVLAATAAIAERNSVRLTRNAELSISLVPTVLAAVLFGPLAAGAVGAASMLGDPELTSRRRDRAPRLKWATYTSTRFVSGAIAGLAAQAVISVVPSTFGGLIAATLIAAFVNEILDLARAELVVRVGAVRARADDGEVDVRVSVLAQEAGEVAGNLAFPAPGEADRLDLLEAGVGCSAGAPMKPATG